jgi:hypothetical protein
VESRQAGFAAIEQTIEKLGPEEFLRIARWISEREQGQWDERMDRDAVSGKLDFLFEEAPLRAIYNKAGGHGLPRNHHD